MQIAILSVMIPTIITGLLGRLYIVKRRLKSAYPLAMVTFVCCNILIVLHVVIHEYLLAALWVICSALWIGTIHDIKRINKINNNLKQ